MQTIAQTRPRGRSPNPRRPPNVRKTVRVPGYRSRWDKQDWQRLAAAVFDRRLDLGFSSRQALADAADFSKRTADAIEMAEGVSPASLKGLERALGWMRGSAEQVLRGGEPAVDVAAPLPPQPIADGDANPFDGPGYTQEDRDFYVYIKSVTPVLTREDWIDFTLTRRNKREANRLRSREDQREFG